MSTAQFTEMSPTHISRSRAKFVSAPAEVFELQPGPAAAVTMEAMGAIAERLTATNGSAPQQRALLRGAAAQLQDTWGNAVAQAGVRVQLSLQWPPEGPPGKSRGAMLSVVCTACSFQAPWCPGSALREKCGCGPVPPRQLFEATPASCSVLRLHGCNFCWCCISQV